MRAGPLGMRLFKRPAPVGAVTYTKYRLSVTDSRSGFWTGLKDFWVSASFGGADTTDAAGNTYFQTVASGGALGTVGNAFDTSSGSPNLATAWNVGFDGPNYPHTIGIDYTGGTPINAAQYGFVADGGNGGPKDWTFEGWNGSAWVVLDTQTGQIFNDGDPFSATL
jgi:hypothetical protein